MFDLVLFKVPCIMENKLIVNKKYPYKIDVENLLSTKLNKFIQNVNVEFLLV